MSEDNVERLSLGHLEREITELAAHINAATCRWLRLVAEFDRRSGWERWGCASCPDWLSLRCALAPSGAREHVRVARRLAELPRIRQVFARGELSYSQVRAITRVATQDTEDDLLNIARHATGAQLERVVRAFRGVLATELGAVNRAYEQRYLVHSHDDDGSLLIHARLPADEGATVLAALDAGRDAMREQLHDADASAEAHAEGGLGASAEARTDDWVAASAEARAERRRVDNADALVLMAESQLADPGRSHTAVERNQVLVHVDAATLGDDQAGGRCELENGHSLHPETVRRLGCDASLVRILEADGTPLSVGRRTRTIPSALRRALESRDRGCRFPGCSRRRHLDAHHVHHWARGGRTELSNLVQLCRHHHRLVHEGGFAVETRSRGRLVFRRPDGTRISPPARPRRGDPGHLTRANHHHHIGADTAVPYCTDPLDLDLTILGLAHADSRIAPERAPPDG